MDSRMKTLITVFFCNVSEKIADFAVVLFYWHTLYTTLFRIIRECLSIVNEHALGCRTNTRCHLPNLLDDYRQTSKRFVAISLQFYAVVFCCNLFHACTFACTVSFVTLFANWFTDDFKSSCLLFRVLLKAVRSRPDAARVGRDSNPCMTVPVPPAAPGLSVVTVGWLLELSFKKPYKMRSLMA